EQQHIPNRIRLTRRHDTPLQGIRLGIPNQSEIDIQAALHRSSILPCRVAACCDANQQALKRLSASPALTQTHPPSPPKLSDARESCSSCRRWSPRGSKSPPPQTKSPSPAAR